MADQGQRQLSKVTYDASEGQTRVLRGYVEGDSEDGLFLVIVRPLGDRVLIRKTDVRSIGPAANTGAFAPKQGART